MIITSATLDGEKFSTYFDSCPVLSVPGRCHEVQVIHTREEHRETYLQSGIDTALNVHLHQGPGDILLFLTGQAEIDQAGYYQLVLLRLDAAMAGIVALPF